MLRRWHCVLRGGFASTPERRNENINWNKYIISSSGDRTFNSVAFTVTLCARAPQLSSNMSYHWLWKEQLLSFLPALLSRTAFRTGGSFLFFVMCSFDDSKVLIKVYLNKEYFEFEFEFFFWIDLEKWLQVLLRVYVVNPKTYFKICNMVLSAIFTCRDKIFCFWAGYLLAGLD